MGQTSRPGSEASVGPAVSLSPTPKIGMRLVFRYRKTTPARYSIPLKSLFHFQNRANPRDQRSRFLVCVADIFALLGGQRLDLTA